VRQDKESTGMEELERYLGSRSRRRKFAVTIRDAADRARWARLQFKIEFPIHAVVVVESRTYESGLTQRWEPHLGLEVHGSLAARASDEAEFIRLDDLVARGQADFAARMAGAGWTDPRGHADRGYEVYWFRRPRPPEDTPAELAAIARRAAAALLGTDEYVLTIEPYQGDLNSIGEYAGYRSLTTMGGFVVSAPIVAMFVALMTQNPLETALVVAILVMIAVLYAVLQPGRDPGRSRPSLEIDLALLKLEMAVHESAVIDIPVIGRPIELLVSLAMLLIGVWVPILVAIVTTSVM
jgi:hypothetical protein